MDVWYDRYESQCWYANTFLVNDFSQISKVIKNEDNDGEWNNIEESGCNFVCLSMMIGINPAYLSSELKKLKFFSHDRSLKSIKLNGDEGFLVWDRNAPSKPGQEIIIKNICHPVRGVVDISVQLIEIAKARNEKEASVLIAHHRSKGNHIICGYDDHSRLVAGIKNRNYFLWDPDLNETDVIENISGGYSLNWFYEQYTKQKEYINKSAEYWFYSVEYSEKIDVDCINAIQ